MTLAARDRGITHPWSDAPVTGRVIEVAEGIFWARLPLPMALDHVNIYWLADADGWTLVDTGLDWAMGRRAMDALLAGPMAGKPVARVLMTHHHPDHIGLAGRFADEGAEVLASRVAWLTGRMLTLDWQDRATPQQIAFRRRAGVTGAALEAYAAEEPFNFAECVAPLPLGYRALEDGDRLRLAGRDWVVRLGEGHAPAHVTLWSADLILAGDQILPGISPNIGVYPTEPEADPLAGWLASCRRFRDVLGAQLVLPGHRLPFRGGAMRLQILIDNHLSALDRIVEGLRRDPKTAVEIFPDLYRREISVSEFGLALVEAVAHVNHLHRAGRVERREDAQGAWLYDAI
ncbi:MAG: MBL fold metallo-hydrolase [Pseudomonadota bacterium]